MSETNTSTAWTLLISPFNVRRIRHWDLVDRVVGDAGPMRTAPLPRVPGLRMLCDSSDEGNLDQPVNEAGKAVLEAFGYPYSAQMRGDIGIFLADAEGVPTDLPQELADRISAVALEARRAR
ncbi:hypothetical protein DLE01_32120 [Streptomyces sp. FT05W]|uniref:hypothetical protein n=1 Tax=[Kitasatospora] papulosa TaxID=1464011 RepID=UPI000BCEE495|nr:MULTISPECIES: hypothetical protein [Streptomyces]PWS47110.1 hypothetical protein DLE01_32120 [Streptomyces sp. FT05W]RAS27255.1 hypothetical protein BCL80_10916 [Streptomyces avidinii]WSI16868.1 hypothetical protein OG336_07595 [[Kitasatospora] papulosa]SNX80147.1 hypothetical protein SAMN05421860_11016 [Streptomyces microflavus]